VKEKITVIESLMAKRGHNSLIIAGDPRYVARLTEALPKSLRGKVIGELKAGISDHQLQGVISQAVDSFLEAEREESFDAVALLIQAVRAGSLATVGFDSTRRALTEGRVFELIISAGLLHEEREELVRLASQQGIQIETVRDCELLEQNGGVGALLRYDLPDLPSDTRGTRRLDGSGAGRGAGEVRTRRSSPSGMRLGRMGRENPGIDTRAGGA
jgi:peptide subunit release factor 1 (eRF1)